MTSPANKALNPRCWPSIPCESVFSPLPFESNRGMSGSGVYSKPRPTAAWPCLMKLSAAKGCTSNGLLGRYQRSGSVSKHGGPVPHSCGPGGFEVAPERRVAARHSSESHRVPKHGHTPQNSERPGIVDWGCGGKGNDI